jgi:hypothetical protein
MAEFYKGIIPIYDPDVPAHRDSLFPKNQARGGVPRDYKIDPETMFAQPTEMKLIDPSEYDAYYDEQEASKSSLEHIYLQGADTPAFINLDQNGQGFCWCYSTGHALMIQRLRQREPVVMLSPHGVACKIKGFRDEGGWCGLSAKFAREVGYPSQTVWPAQSMNRQYDNEATWANAALHKITEDWVDLTKSEYDQNLTSQQLFTCSFLNIPGPVDFNWWSHSVCRIRHVRIEAGSWGLLILNSWLNWGRHGLAVLRGSKMIPDGALAIRSTQPSLV